MKGFFYSKYFLMGLAVLSFAACSDEDTPRQINPPIEPVTDEEWYAGGLLGTTFNSSASAYEDPTPAVEKPRYDPTSSSMENISLSVPTHKTRSRSTVSVHFMYATPVCPAIRDMGMENVWNGIVPMIGETVICW